MSSLFAKHRPGLVIPKFFPLSPRDHAAFWIGTGFGSGLLRPASGTWGSLVGMGYLWLWWRLPGLPLQVATEFLLLPVSIWAASRCEKLFQKKDPGDVVIDEIIVTPFAFYPMLYFGEQRWWVWVLGFVIYRIMDILKVWPGRRLEHLGGGLGIVADDVCSAIYTGFLLWGLELVLRPSL